MSKTYAELAEELYNCWLGMTKTLQPSWEDADAQMVDIFLDYAQTAFEYFGEIEG